MSASSWAKVVNEAERPSDEVALQVGTPPTTESMFPVEPIVRLASVLAPEA
jgi:hypothetical protein